MRNRGAKSVVPEGKIFLNQDFTPAKVASLRTLKSINRVQVSSVMPQIDSGKFAIKRVLGESVTVSAVMLVDGHDRIAAVLQYRRQGSTVWQETPMFVESDDNYRARFTVSDLGFYEYTVLGWVDTFGTWIKELRARWSGGQKNLDGELSEGAQILKQVASRATVPQDSQLLRQIGQLLSQEQDTAKRVEAVLDPALTKCVARYPDRGNCSSYDKVLRVKVETQRAAQGAWYEIFPRSAGKDSSRSATFREAQERLPEIARMGFDILYLPPIHPIGRTARKGPNNSLNATAQDPGSPWAIGGAAGGHMAIEPGLGTLQDFTDFLKAARKLDIQIALDLALQCSRDHPYLTDHPDWFRHRPDGTIKYAENPPKKYEDIVPFDFECQDWKNLWAELKGIVDFWIEQGVKIFRVDNPHTKPLEFWDWLIACVQSEHPDTVFLAEAFTRPALMQRLAKGGFSQSYTYFTWRNSKRELTDYLTELTQTDVAEYMRPNFFANTPDILHEYLQVGGRPAFQIRLVLAATMASSYGIYGPAFELCIGRAVPGTEEYQDSEKYQIRQWNYECPDNLGDFIGRVNEIRRNHRVLLDNRSLRFYRVDNEQLLCYAKILPGEREGLIVVVNLDPRNVQSGWIWVPVGDFGLQSSDNYPVHDLLSDTSYLWKGESNFVKLDPKACPAHILRVQRRVHSEEDFDTFA